MLIEIPKEAEGILRVLNEHGYEAYIVGGCVRDSLLGRMPGDWDITTSAEPLEVKKYFSHTYDTGIQHGTVTVLIGKESYEVTTYRIEGKYDDCRHPSQVSFTKNLYEDLLRRDFTINAMAYHPTQGIVDPYNGQQDILNRLIRGVGNPNERFNEDALRMMRGIRFSAQLDFEIETETYNAIKNNSHLIQKVSRERIHDELHKLLMSKYPERFELLCHSGIMGYILPEYLDNNERQQSNTIEILKKVTQKGFIGYKNTIIRWTVFLENILNLKEVLKGLRFDNKTMTDIISLSQRQNMLITNEYEVRKTISETSCFIFETLLDLKSCRLEETCNILELKCIYQKVIRQKDCVDMKKMCITGEDLLNIGFPKGKAIGDILKLLFEIVLHEPSKNQKEILLNEALRYKSMII